MPTIKCVTVGDGGVGKSCMLISYVHGYTPGVYLPTIFDNMTLTVEINDRSLRLEVCDTAGQENYDFLRFLSYTNTEVILLCFSIVNPSSFKNIELKWLKEVKHHCFFAKIILIGTKSDLRNDQEIIQTLRKRNEKPITRSEGIALARKIKAFEYVECSALTGDGLSKVFGAAAKSALPPSAAKSLIKKRKQCSIL